MRVRADPVGPDRVLRNRNAVGGRGKLGVAEQSRHVFGRTHIGLPRCHGARHRGAHDGERDGVEPCGSVARVQHAEHHLRGAGVHGQLDFVAGPRRRASGTAGIHVVELKRFPEAVDAHPEAGISGPDISRPNVAAEMQPSTNGVRERKCLDPHSELAGVRNVRRRVDPTCPKAEPSGERRGGVDGDLKSDAIDAPAGHVTGGVVRLEAEVGGGLSERGCRKRESGGAGDAPQRGHVAGGSHLAEYAARHHHARTPTTVAPRSPPMRPVLWPTLTTTRSLPVNPSPLEFRCHTSE